MSSVQSSARLSFQQLDWEMQALPDWVLHSSRLSLSRELSFATPGRAFRFLSASSLWSCGRRQWPLFSLEKTQVWVTIRNLEHGITERDLALARQIEGLYQHCSPDGRSPGRPAANAGAPTAEDWTTSAGVDRLVERAVAAARHLVAEFERTRPAAEATEET